MFIMTINLNHCGATVAAAKNRKLPLSVNYVTHVEYNP